MFKFEKPNRSEIINDAKKAALQEIQETMPSSEDMEFQKQEEIEMSFTNQESRHQAFEQRQAKREQTGEDIVANRNRRQFKGLEADVLPYFENGEHREVFYTRENLKWFDTHDMQAIIEDIKTDGNQEELVYAESVLAKKQKLEELESLARKAFRSMLSFEKGSRERIEAHELWTEAKSQVINFESQILDTPVREIEQTDIPLDQQAA